MSDEDHSHYYLITDVSGVYPKPDAQPVEDLRALKPIFATCHVKTPLADLAKSIADQWESLKP